MTVGTSEQTDALLDALAAALATTTSATAA